MIEGMLLETLEKIITISGSIILGYSAWQMIKDRFNQKNPTNEDRSCSYLILGKPGTGKTGKALLMFYDDVNNKNLGALWLSTQGIENSEVLDFIKEDRVKDTILIRPYDEKPLGINILRRYTNTSLERELIADSVVTLFKRLFDDVKDNMKAIIYSATIALLTYSENKKEKVSLWDLYEFLNNKKYRDNILKEVEMPVVKDTFKDIQGEKDSSLKAVIRRFRKALSSEHLLIFLSQKENDIDLLECVKKNKIVVCDLLVGGAGAKGLGVQNSAFLAELIVSKFQLIAETRNLKSKLYPLYLDEFQTYTSTADNITRMIELNRQRRMPVVLICQRLSQLDRQLQEAIDNVGTKYIFKTNHKDNELMSKKYPQFKDQFEFLHKRVYIKDELINGKSYISKDRTPNFPKKFNLSKEIINQCKGKRSRHELLQEVYTTKSTTESHTFQ